MLLLQWYRYDKLFSLKDHHVDEILVMVMEHSFAQLCVSDISLWNIWRILVWGRLLPVSEIIVVILTIYAMF